MAVIGLKYNPFLPTLTPDAVWTLPGAEHFAKRIEPLDDEAQEISSQCPSQRATTRKTFHPNKNQLQITSTGCRPANLLKALVYLDRSSIVYRGSDSLICRVCSHLTKLQSEFDLDDTLPALRLLRKSAPNPPGASPCLFIFFFLWSCGGLTSLRFRGQSSSRPSSKQIDR